ncbi:hypothetical protein F3Y22_tig00117056pilonHSYRG00891 [Hibiscus syriacus]|uniref:Uncharacterized protein n=1 Tax=Hibiscus syriacus TaxID=106335 RepID=A0A6A2WWI3_HIBSY|nr:uncharacterized protein LOC120198110 [Hibiscus syriacus]KAE8654106.1 hypothetical protein F3Y22_tig00117056pilonHSYRG00891 [Hibiscus syriacus]
MGTCFSSEELMSESTHHATAHVVSVNGDLHRYNLPVFVSQVLHAETASSSSSSDIFLCNSDSLSYEEYIPALDVDDQLQANQMYFVLPILKLQHRLASKDMAALAVKASLAMENDSKNYSNRRKKARISPVTVAAAYQSPSDSVGPGAKSFSKPQPRQPGMSRSGSIRKFQRYTSRRAKLAVRSFKLRLSTIYEGSVL